MLFFFLNVLRAGVEGSRGLSQLGFQFGLSNGMESNYIRHVAMALLKALHDDAMAKIVWPSAGEREDMRGLMYGFDSAIGLVDGIKQHTFRITPEPERRT